MSTMSEINVTYSAGANDGSKISRLDIRASTSCSSVPFPISFVIMCTSVTYIFTLFEVHSPIRVEVMICIKKKNLGVFLA